MKTKTTTAALLAAILGFGSAGPSAAQVPLMMNYQGHVSHTDGTPVPDTAGQFKFALVSPGTNTAVQATAEAVQLTPPYDQRITSIRVLNPGSGYLTAPLVTITDLAGSGVGAEARANVFNGRILSITVVNGGFGYVRPVVEIAPPPDYWIFVSYWSNDGSSVGGSEPDSAVAVPVTNGLFSVTLGGSGMEAIPLDVFLHPHVHLRIWFTEDDSSPLIQLTPDIPITSVGYAMVAGLVAGEAVTTANLASQSVTTDKLGDGAVTAGKILDGTIELGDLSAPAQNAFWRVDGNAGTTPGLNFLGSTDDQPVELKVNGLRALRLEPTGDSRDFNALPDGAPNVVGGSPANFVAAGVVGATITGGGATNFDGLASRNSVAADYASIGGGRDNSIGLIANSATIGGGSLNNISQYSASATIAGGTYNTIFARAASSAIGGGFDNNIAEASEYATIAGGWSNDIGTNASESTIGGGSANGIADKSHHATIAGGHWNDIGTNSAYSTISGGQENKIAEASESATIAGGYGNDIGTNAIYNTIGGGSDNNIGDKSGHSTIAGGGLNNIGRESSDSTIGGGNRNTIAAASGRATIAGGYKNNIGTNAIASTIAGGEANNIGTNSLYGAIAGGYLNDIGTNAWFGTIGGGLDNNIGANSQSSTIAGGHLNDIGTNSGWSAIGGGEINNIAAGSAFSTIAGGRLNDVGSNSWYGVIGGGYDNNVLSNSWFGTIPGGQSNLATNYAFAAGYNARATHTGAFVWSDSTGTLTGSTNANSVTLRASGGYRFFTSTGTAGAYLAPGGGSWTSLSDRNAKENFVGVNARAVLEKVAALPLSTWNYKSQDTGVRHIGPMAQDFKAAFAVGESETGITTVDADGVALAAVQGLNQKVEHETKQKDAEIAALKHEIGELKQLIRSLAAQQGAGR